MRKTLVFSVVVLLFAVAAAAQDVPRGETFLGFTYTRVNSASNVPAFSANGGGGQFVLNFNKWLGVVADVGAVHNGNIGGYHLDTTLTNFVFGPRVAIRKWNRVTPYFQILWGGVYGSTSAQVTIPEDSTIVVPPNIVKAGQVVAVRASKAETAFAMMLGGGLDIKISKAVSFRPIGLDWYMTRLQNLRSMEDNNQHCLRYTTGFNFTFGAQ